MWKEYSTPLEKRRPGRAAKVSITVEQGTKMGRQSTLHIALEYGESKDIPERIEVGGSVMPVLSGTLSDFS